MHKKASLLLLDKSNLTITNLCEIYMTFASLFGFDNLFSRSMIQTDYLLSFHSSISCAFIIFIAPFCMERHRLNSHLLVPRGI